jgi:carbamoyl-phosphate synthase large subunit
MKDGYNVFIVPAGSGMAISAITKLKEDKKIRIIAADVDKLAPGLHLSDKAYKIPPFSSPDFYPSLFTIFKKEHIDVIIPALDNLLLEFSEKKREFQSYGVETVISVPDTIKISRDKWLTYLKLKDLVPFPKSFIQLNEIDIEFPLFIKQRDGSGSNDIHLVSNDQDLTFYYQSVTKPIIQEYLPGKEYTVDCLADRGGNLIVCIPRERIETKCGISVKGRILKSKVIDDIAHKIACNLKFFGPFFFQLKEDCTGKLKIMEINPRISGTMSLSGASGVNIHSLAVRMVMGEKIETPPIKSGIYITRYWNDIILEENDLGNIDEIMSCDKQIS